MTDKEIEKLVKEEKIKLLKAILNDAWNGTGIRRIAKKYLTDLEQDEE